MVTDNAGVRVATLNVLGPANPRWDERRQLIRNTLKAAAADVVALQEVPIASAPDVVDDLLDGGYHVTGFAEAADDGVGGALATRWPHEVIDEIDQRRTPRSADFPWCSTLLVATDSPAGRLLIVHHKPSWQFGYEYEREQQAVAAAKVIEGRGDDVDHVIVLGDFDAPPDAGSMQFWRGRHSLDGLSVCYQDAWETVRPAEAGFTFDAKNPLVRAGEVATAASRRIDYVLVRAGVHGPTLQVRDCRLLLNEAVQGVWASDHFGVLADFAVPKHLPGAWGELD